jgi:hypothetical protein
MQRESNVTLPVSISPRAGMRISDRTITTSTVHRRCLAERENLRAVP